MTDFDLIKCMAIAKQGFDAWAQKDHNRRWFRKIDGTPIPNDLTVNIAEAFRDALEAATPEPAPDKPGQAVTIPYTNWRGEFAMREIVPEALFWGSNEWHPEPQWLILAHDVAKGDARTVALAGIGYPALDRFKEALAAHPQPAPAVRVPESLRALSEEATPGPWRVRPTKGHCDDHIVTDHPDFQQKPHGNYVGETSYAAGHAEQRFAEDSALIAEAVNWVRSLLSDPSAAEAKPAGAMGWQMPNGWKLVPSEPTEVMKDAGIKASPMFSVRELHLQGGRTSMTTDHAAKVFAAMLDAAPDQEFWFPPPHQIVRSAAQPDTSQPQPDTETPGSRQGRGPGEGATNTGDPRPSPQPQPSAVEAMVKALEPFARCADNLDFATCGGSTGTLSRSTFNAAREALAAYRATAPDQSRLRDRLAKIIFNCDAYADLGNVGEAVVSSVLREVDQSRRAVMEAPPVVVTGEAIHRAWRAFSESRGDMRAALLAAFPNAGSGE